MTQDEMKAERRQVVDFLVQAAGATLIEHLWRRWSDGPTVEDQVQALKRLGKLEALAEIARLRRDGP